VENNVTTNSKMHSSVSKYNYFPVSHYNEGGETLAQVTHRGGGCPIPGNIQGQVGRLDQVEGVPAHSRGIGLDDL